MCIRDSNKSKWYLLAWTTTPWTLPSNLACAVGKDIQYTLLSNGKENYILASNILKKYENELSEFSIIKEIMGKELVDSTYKPLFPYFENRKNAFRVLSADFVNTDEGTGIVHMAPGFGEDDQNVCEKNNIELVCPVDEQGNFTKEVSDLSLIHI